MWRLSPSVPTKSRTARRCRHIITPDTYMWIAMQRLLNLQCQAVHATAHVRRTGGQPDPNTGWWRNHPRSIVTTRRSVARLTSCPILMEVPSGSVISILPSATAASRPFTAAPPHAWCRSPFVGSLIICTGQEYRRWLRPEHAAAHLAAPVPQQTSADLYRRAISAMPRQAVRSPLQSGASPPSSNAAAVQPR